MSIDEVIDEMKELSQPCDEHCGDKYITCEKCRSKPKQVAEWLEELKAMRNLDKTNFNDGYNKGIDDFVEILLKHKSKDDYPIMCFDEETIKKFAEQLKDGVING